MQYKNVCLESVGYVLPDEVLSSEEIETRLEPVYRRLRLPHGRLELMTGIRERRFWAPGVLPGEISVQSAQRAILAADVDKGDVGALIHASVCRDYLEPATACGVHHALGLRRECLIYDVSNACLGMLNGMVQVANMIELGQIRAGVVVGTESSRQLVETTIESLNKNLSLTRDEAKLAVASLTIGSASAAVVLVDARISRTKNRILAAAARANTACADLCRSGRDESVAGDMRPLMSTDSERLLHEGIATGVETFAAFLDETGWTPRDIQKTFCHQVGAGHRKLMLEAFALDPAVDFSTFAFLGNTGSAALPVTLALGIEQGHLKKDDHVALLGIGSGISSLMIGVDWQRSPTVIPRDPSLETSAPTVARDPHLSTR